MATHGAFLPSVPSHLSENNIGNISRQQNIKATTMATETLSDRFFCDKWWFGKVR